MPAVLASILASIAPMTVCAGVMPTAYAVTGLTGIPVAFIAVAVILALFCVGYVAMSRRIRNAGADAFVSPGLGRTTGVAAALMALVAYESFQVATAPADWLQWALDYATAPLHGAASTLSPVVDDGTMGPNRGLHSRRLPASTFLAYPPGRTGPVTRRMPGQRPQSLSCTRWRR